LLQSLRHLDWVIHAKQRSGAGVSLDWSRRAHYATQEDLIRTRSAAGRQCATAIVGKSLAIVRLRAEIDRVAPFSSTVLVTGPSGTGKELVAREIHAHSPRSQHPYIPVDCASMAGELMASQLFGHVAGAFTGANCEALGCFRAANHGTLFLDEIGEIEYRLQAKLLRVLQEHVVMPVGSHQGQHVDVRVIAATNRNLRVDVVQGRFREDLYYRLDVVHLRTTALQNRPDDICLLANVFLHQLAAEGLPACTLSKEASAVLVESCWPGNVRQLRNVLEQAAIETEERVIPAELLRRNISLSFASDDSADSSTSLASPLEGSSIAHSSHLAPAQETTAQKEAAKFKKLAWQTLEHVEREHIVRTLEHTFGNRSAAARLLGVTRQSLLRKMKRYGLDIADMGGALG
jgi:DNA-binding NtrC family response regulator